MRGSGSLVRKHVKGCTKVRCSCPYAVRYRDGEVNRSKSFSTKPLALDFQAQLLRDHRSGEETFAGKSQGAVKFVTYASEWINGHQNQGTRGWMNTTLKLHVAPAVGNRTIAQVANDREFVQKLISSSTLSYQRKIRLVIVGPLNEALKSGRIASHRLLGLKVEEPAITKDLTPATRSQLNQMALALGDRAMIIWLGVYAGLRPGESLGVNISDFIEDGTVLRVQRQRADDGTLIGNLKARRAGEFRDVPVSSELWAKVCRAPRDEDGYLLRSEWRHSTHYALPLSRCCSGSKNGIIIMPDITLDDIKSAIVALDIKREQLVADAIGAELLQLEEFYDQNITEKSDLARDAIKALEQPQSELAALEREIQAVQGKAAHWEARMDGKPAELRVEAHRRFDDWNQELSQLEAKRDQLERDLEPLTEHASETRRAAEDAVMGKVVWTAAIQNPFTHHLGQITESYVQFRIPMLVETAVANDRENPEHEQCIKLARLLALVTGFRTCRKCGGENDLPDDRALTLAGYDEYRDQIRAGEIIQPSARDVLHAQDQIMQRLAEDQRHRDHIEDLRDVKIPRNLRVPDYKRVEDVSEFMRPR
jgi:integrase